jgi:hypothetical protein
MIFITTLNIVVILMAYLARFENHRYLLAWAFVLLALVLGIRYGYGNDFFAYKYMFDHGYPEDGFRDDVEPGWYILNKLFKPFGFSSFVFFLTAIEHVMLYDLIRRYVPPQYYWMAVFIYVFNPNYMLIGLSMMRQFLVQVIGLYAVGFAIKKQILPFIVIIMMGFFIHKVALLLLPLFFLPYIKTAKWWLFLVVFVALYVVIQNMSAIIETMFEGIQETGMKYADDYLNEEIINGNNTLDKKYIFHYFIFMFLFVSNVNKLESIEKSYSWMVVIGVFFLPFALLFPMALRTSWIYTIAEIISLPLLFSKERIQIVKYGFIIMFVLITLWIDYRAIFLSDIYGPYFENYHTIFSDYAINDIRLY